MNEPEPSGEREGRHDGDGDRSWSAGGTIGALVLAAASGAFVLLGRSDHRPSANAALEEPSRTDQPARTRASPEAPPPSSADVVSSTARRQPTSDRDVRALIIGGGADPASNQVSIEEDLALVAGAFGAKTRILFASGDDRPVVQEGAGAEAPALRARLGELLDPRPGRGATFRATTLPIDGPATATHGLATLRSLASLSLRAPLYVYLAGHGDQAPGIEPRWAGRFATWGGAAITPAEVAAVVDEARRPVRLVLTSCYGGTFADVVFAGADPTRPPTRADVCGFFATHWDREASGCDASPDRNELESYGRRFATGLSDVSLGETSKFDLDRDGAVSLLELHTAARIGANSIDVPLTTSTHFLRELGLRVTPADHLEIPEERAVIASLSDKLHVASDAEAARRELSRLTRELGDHERRREELSEAVDSTWAALRIDLLSRWPALGDPYGSTFDTVLTDHGVDIETLLDTSAAATSYRDAEEALFGVDARLSGLDVQLALAQRLVDAHDTMELGGALARQHGPLFERWLGLLSCEREPLEFR